MSTHFANSENHRPTSRLIVVHLYQRIFLYVLDPCFIYVLSANQLLTALLTLPSPHYLLHYLLYPRPTTYPTLAPLLSPTSTAYRIISSLAYLYQLVTHVEALNCDGFCASYSSGSARYVLGGNGELVALFVYQYIVASAHEAVMRAIECRVVGVARSPAYSCIRYKGQISKIYL